jgi:putative nucleotidyltransferase with HDIG domain
MERLEPDRSPAPNQMLSADVLLKTIQAIAAAVDAKSLFSSEHSSHVTQFCVEIGAEMGLPQDSLETLEFAANIHDIGKIGTPDSVLNKIGRLTSDDWTNIREHPGVGASFLSRIDELEEVARIIRHHHERMDGFGYPDKLKGRAIPLLSRILAVADAFEAMTSNRPHRCAMGTAEALHELQANAGEQFDPDVVRAAANVIERQYLGGIGKRAA